MRLLNLGVLRRIDDSRKKDEVITMLRQVSVAGVFACDVILALVVFFSQQMDGDRRAMRKMKTDFKDELQRLAESEADRQKLERRVVGFGFRNSPLFFPCLACVVSSVVAGVAEGGQRQAPDGQAAAGRWQACGNPASRPHHVDVVAAGPDRAGAGEGGQTTSQLVEEVFAR